MANPYPGSPRFSSTRWESRGKRVRSLTTSIIPTSSDEEEMVEAVAERLDGSRTALVVPTSDPLVHWVTDEPNPRRYTQRRKAEARERYLKDMKKGRRKREAGGGVSGG